MATRSRGVRRGGYAPARPSSNAGALAIAAVLVIGGIVAVVLLAGGKKDKKGTTDMPPAATPAAPPVVGTPTPPPPPPYPDLAPDRIAEIRKQVGEIGPFVTRGQAFYDEAMKAKNAGDEETWQAKLWEASGEFEVIKDMWNEVIATMPTNEHYDEEAVANHYLGAEGDKVTKALSTLAGIKKQLRPR